MPLRLLICVTAFALLAGGVALSDDRHAPEHLTAPMTTREHLRASPWWPTKPAAPNQQFVGSAACARCHAGLAASQSTSQMARTLGHASSSDVLRHHLASEYHSGPYTSLLRQSGKDFTLQVSAADHPETRSATLDWYFGSGDVGQSYLWQKDGAFEESRFNFFATTDNLDATPGRLHGTPVSLDMALARPLEAFEARTCFSCHTTTMSAAEPLDTASVVPGIGCEACHGPGGDHIRAVEAHRAATTSAGITAVANPVLAAVAWDRHIVNPARLTPAESVDLCGSCHSTPWDVRLLGAAGVKTVRFPAYRLEQSRCWGVAGDARVTCQACHDPHAPLEHTAAAYDTSCLQCHANRPADGQLASTGSPASPHAQHPGKACPVATRDCVTCHMPKFDLPEMHYKFTDHRIRVARNDAPFPD